MEGTGLCLSAACQTLLSKELEGGQWGRVVGGGVPAQSPRGLGVFGGASPVHPLSHFLRGGGALPCCLPPVAGARIGAPRACLGPAGGTEAAQLGSWLLTQQCTQAQPVVGLGREGGTQKGGGTREALSPESSLWLPELPKPAGSGPVTAGRRHDGRPASTRLQPTSSVRAPGALLPGSAGPVGEQAAAQHRRQALGSGAQQAAPSQGARGRLGGGREGVG